MPFHPAARMIPWTIYKDSELGRMAQKKKSSKKSSGQASTQASSSSSQGAPQKSAAQEAAEHINGLPEDCRTETREGTAEAGSLTQHVLMSTHQGFKGRALYPSDAVTGSFVRLYVTILLHPQSCFSRNP